MSDIFVSYANEDRKRIKPLVHALEEAGWSVFWDPDIPTGSTWREVLGSEVDSCRCMVVAWSEESIQSHWVQDEAQAGKSRNILVPILLDDVSPPLGFRGIQTANLVSWNHEAPSPVFNRLLADISKLLGTASDKVTQVLPQQHEEVVSTHKTGDASILDKWKALSQDNRVKLMIVILGAVLAVIGYFGKSWLESAKSPPVVIDSSTPSRNYTKSTVTQTTSGDSSPAVSGTKGDVTININGPDPR